MPQSSNNVPVRWFVLAFFAIVIIVALLKKDEGGSSLTIPTEREKNEAGVSGYFKSKYPSVPDHEINEASKRIVEEWERAK